MSNLRAELEDYYGSVMEFALGVSTRGAKPKPEALKIYEQMDKMRMPIVAGGQQDQPHVWLLMWGIVDEVRSVYLPQLQATQNGSGDG